MKKAEYSGHPATTHDTVDEIVKRSKRSFFPLRRTFIQQKTGRVPTPGPLAGFVSAGDRTALLLYFLALTKASQAPWDVSLHSAVWARALGLSNPTGSSARGRVSKAWTRLVDRRLLTRSRRSRIAEFTLLREDGSGDPYTRPKAAFIKVPHELWTRGPKPQTTRTPTRWFEMLSLPELTFLVIGLTNLDSFPLPVERGPAYYGISADTLLRGSRGLRDHGCLTVRKQRITAPLAPEGISWENRYTLNPPFGPRGRISTAAGAFR